MNFGRNLNHFIVQKDFFIELIMEFMFFKSFMSISIWYDFFTVRAKCVPVWHTIKINLNKLSG